jgi:hypothetical protein
MATVVEIFINSAWVNITADVLERAGISITGGRSDRSTNAQPSQCVLTVNNRAGKYSPRNPLSVYYGQLGRNTPIRVTTDGVRRFWGEIAELPPRWDATGTDAYVPLVANGVLRRVLQGDRPLGSSLRSYYETFTLLDYWPLDEGASNRVGANADGSGLSDPFQLTVGLRQTGSAQWGGDLGLFLGTGMQLNTSGIGSAFGSIGSSPSTTHSFEFVYKMGGVGLGLGNTVATLHLYDPITDQSPAWLINLDHDGVNNWIRLQKTNIGGVEVDVNTGLNTALYDGQLHHVRLTLTESGANVLYTLYLDGSSVVSGSDASASLEGMRICTFTFIPAVTGNFITIGHVAAWDAANPAPPVATAAQAAMGWVGEAAGRRIERMMAEVDMPFVSVGDLDDTIAMGPQYNDYLANQLTEIEATSQGVIYEPRDSLALGFRTLSSMYNQAAAVTLSMTAGQLAPGFEPVDDDQELRNDVFAQRRDGGSFQATLETGALSVQDPPNGVGRYKDEIQFNPESDDLLAPLAGWFLTRGTLDEARYPQLAVNLNADGVSPALAAQLAAVDIGDRIVVTNTDRLNVYDDIALIVMGYTETLTTFTREIVFNCIPASVFDVAQVNHADTKVSPGEGSTLNSSLTSTATSMSVASSGFLWTTSGGEMPIDLMVGGEHIRVTAISGGASPQTFTITRSVNGVVKAHSSGAVVRLKRPARVGL